jgi:septal ring factor EnvC (AmiA/AmiB activator)
MYSIQTNAMYSIDENGKHSIEIAYKDSDGIDASAYSEGNDVMSVISDIADKLDKQIADFDDKKADAEEQKMLESQISDLEAKINDLKAQLDDTVSKKNALKKKPAAHENVNKISSDDLNKMFNKHFWDFFA